MLTWLQRSLTSRQRTLLILALTTVFATGFSVSVIYFTDLLLPDFTARFDNYAFATGIPLAASPLLIYPMLYLQQRMELAQAALEYMARTDVLTGVANRRGFFEAAESLAAEHGEIALMMVDIDHFKRVNDRHGHAVGDELLKHVAQTIGDTVKEPAGIVGRIGGEEFAVLLAGSGAGRAEQFAERLCRNARTAGFEHDGEFVGATLSIGLALGGPGDSVDALMKAADMAAYEAKRSGRDRWSRAGDGETAAKRRMRAPTLSPEAA